MKPARASGGGLQLLRRLTPAIGLGGALLLLACDGEIVPSTALDDSTYAGEEHAAPQEGAAGEQPDETRAVSRDAPPVAEGGAGEAVAGEQPGETEDPPGDEPGDDDQPGDDQPGDDDPEGPDCDALTDWVEDALCDEIQEQIALANSNAEGPLYPEMTCHDLFGPSLPTDPSWAAQSHCGDVVETAETRVMMDLWSAVSQPNDWPPADPHQVCPEAYDRLTTLATLARTRLCG